MGKGLRVALLALLLLAMFGAAKASAATVITGSNEFTFEDEGEGYHILAPGALAFWCLTATVAGTASASEEVSLTLHPTFDDCAEEATVDTTGCNYVLYASTNAEGHGKTEIECTAGNVIRFTSPLCSFILPPQTATGGFSYTNSGSGSSREVTAKFTTTLTLNNKSGPFCFYVGSTLNYEGALTLKGYEDKGGPTNEDEFLEGAQRGIWWEKKAFRTE